MLGAVAKEADGQSLTEHWCVSPCSVVNSQSDSVVGSSPLCVVAQMYYLFTHSMNLCTVQHVYNEKKGTKNRKRQM